jgi:hypothetical protein
MNNPDSGINQLVSKVLVLEHTGIAFDSLKAFYEECGLVGIRPQKNDAASVMTILRSNVDLGGIMLYEDFNENGLTLAREIHAMRPELPIFLRRDTVASVAGLSEKDASMFRCAYTLSDLHLLRESLAASIFNRIYPNDLVRGITQITSASLASVFRDCDIEVETPYLVKDRIIYGEVFSMIAIESNWCRGYMMLQVEENAMMEIMRHAAANDAEPVTFRELNNVLSEATNLVWGAFKNRYVGQDQNKDNLLLTQVPIIINHQRHFISFGSDDPQLCLKYILRLRAQPDAAPVFLFQRFVFNLNWSPDEFRETSVESLVDSGELELF